MNDNNDNTKDGRVEKRMGNTVEVCFFYNLFSLIKKIYRDGFFTDLFLQVCIMIFLRTYPQLYRNEKFTFSIRISIELFENFYTVFLKP